MDLKLLTHLTEEFLFHKKLKLSGALKKQYDVFLKENQKNICSSILFEYTLVEFPEAEARLFLEGAAASCTKLEKALKRKLDFRVALLDWLLLHSKEVKRISEPRIVESRTLTNLSRLIEKDELTGLFNFRYFDAELNKEFSRALRYNSGFSLAIIDIDDFKLYNDTFGHFEGNRVLHRIGEILKEEIRTSDVACRYGGEEFALILPHTEKKAALILCEKLRQLIEVQHFKRKVTISGGVAEFPLDTEKTDRSLFEFADKALYQSKRSGKNQFTLFYHEKRAFERVNPLDIGLKGIAHAKGMNITVENISARGMKIEMGKIIKDFNENKVSFHLNFQDEQTITVDGRVAYMFPKKGKSRAVGLSFMNYVGEIDQRIKNLSVKPAAKKPKGT